MDSYFVTWARQALEASERSTARYWLNRRMNRLPHRRRPLPAPVQFRQQVGPHDDYMSYIDLLDYVCRELDYPENHATGLLWRFSAIWDELHIYVQGAKFQVGDKPGAVWSLGYRRGEFSLPELCTISDVFVPIHWTRAVIRLIHAGVGGLKTRETMEPLDYAITAYGFGMYTVTNVLVDFTLPTPRT